MDRIDFVADVSYDVAALSRLPAGFLCPYSWPRQYLDFQTIIHNSLTAHQ